ncbi:MULTISPECIES: tail assembly protein [Pseudomonas]|uniref:Tail assembly protein n=4 Tax=Pseudomonas TaxID=286 RepID=A0A7W2JQ40_9PSED|nr:MULTISPECIES: tail assembly protein [Pseudomonas]NOY03325.1 tail assembly protein [Gammaproteobacteria bacterium]MBA6063071.1 tail assembly protein [Pseudomonas juntendi]MBH3375478.1 tail assembly protein [Pseudomonas juntendi]MBR7519623.1 tail assembly protein [Pseudomonas juntendi]MCK2118775.1 tail assembly protein [Pseudomonas juntendi]
MNPEMTAIEFSGSFRKALGRKHQRLLDTGSVRELLKALTITLPGFKEEVDRLDRLGMRFAIFRNGKNVGESEFERGGTRTVKIVPVVSGSKRGGLLQTVVGAVLIAAGVFLSSTPFGAPLLGAGVAMVAGGVIQMLSPQAKGLSQSAAPENLPSYAFGSAKNTTASGNPVPICIGDRRWGGAIISASIEAQDKA